MIELTIEGRAYREVAPQGGARQPDAAVRQEVADRAREEREERWRRIAAGERPPMALEGREYGREYEVGEPVWRVDARESVPTRAGEAAKNYLIRTCGSPEEALLAVLRLERLLAA